jgi:predicted dithiol-disulfide oxidoreductase (DUF899 family)/ketosteroid isomerase-like protein
MKTPPVVSPEKWQAALDALRAKEKRATRERDALAAERRALPRVRIEKDYVLDGPNGKARLAELFEGRRQLLLYHFMFGPSRSAGCDGCSMVIDQIGHPAHLHARDTTFAIVSRAPFEKIEAYRRRMGWQRPWYSSFGTDFNFDFGVGPKEPQPERDQDGEQFGMSAFLRDGADVYRTYFTTARGVEALGSVWTLLDLTPFGRQEAWEDAPEGTPQTKPYQWWRRHDEYEAAGPSDAQQIAEVLQRRSEAHRAKDAAAIAAPYARDAITYDLAPPLVHRGVEPSELERWLATWDGPVSIETKDLDVSVDGSLGVAHGLARMRGRQQGEERDLWFRATTVLAKAGGRWRIVHEHTSVPFHMDGSFRAAVDLKPE